MKSLQLMRLIFGLWLQACQKTPRIRDTKHLFLELPLLKDKLVEYINKMSVAGSWSQNAINTTQAWLTEGLKARCITRDLKWGFLYHMRILRTRQDKISINDGTFSILLLIISLELIYVSVHSNLVVIGFLCLVWCTYWICLNYFMLHSWLGEMVEKSWRRGVVSVYGKRQCTISYCKYHFQNFLHYFDW